MAPASYALRKLRAGYVYVYDEALNEFESYAVDVNSVLYRMGGEAPRRQPQFTEPCSQAGHRAAAMCITVPLPQHATRVWVAYSESAWTAAVCRAHKKDAALRQRSMRCLDVKHWLATQAHPSALPIAQVGEQVAEYAVYGPTRRNWLKQDSDWFTWSTAEPTRVDSAAGIVRVAEHLMPGKGVMLALPDPVGVLRDLAALAARRRTKFYQHPKIRREAAVSSAIMMIKAAVLNQYELQDVASTGTDILRQRMGHVELNGSMGAYGPVTLRSESKAQSLERALDAPGRLEMMAEKHWQKYAAKYNEPSRAAWQQAIDSRWQAYAKAQIQPLAEAHAQWLQSPLLAQLLDAHHDRDNPRSGLDYAQQVLGCITGMQEHRSCFDAMQAQLLRETPDEAGSVLLRALYFNQRSVATQMRAALDSGLDLRSLPWDGPIGAYTSVVEALGNGADGVAAKLVEQLMGPLLRALNATVDGGARATMLALGQISGRALFAVEVYGPKWKFRERVIRELLERSEVPMRRHATEAAVNAEIRRLKLKGIDLEGNGRLRWVVMVDPEKARAGELKGLLSAQQAETADMKQWRSTINTNVRLGTVGALLQVAALTKLWSDVDESMEHERMEAKLRMVAGIGSLAGTTAETVGKALENYFAQRPGGLSVANRLVVVGRVTTAAAGVVMAVLDGVKGVQELLDGSHAVGALYVISAGLGFAVLYFAGSSSTLPGIGWIAAVLLIGVAVFIELLKDNKLQDWLERCLWGNLGAEKRYIHLETEMRELQVALGYEQ